MKKTILLAGAILSLTIMAFTPKKLHVDIYKVDNKQSKLEWFAEKLTGKHNGTIMLSGGELKNDHANFTGIFEIDMTTIANLDLENETYKTKLEKHLKSEDFFDVAKYPKSTFVITSVTQNQNSKPGGVTHTVKGNLTIKDKTNEISFAAVVTTMSDKIICAGTATIDRSKFDVKYGSKSFFPEIGDKIIYDEFTLKFNVVALKQ